MTLAIKSLDLFQLIHDYPYCRQITECSTNSIDIMPIGKSKISDMDFGSFENTIDKNIETDKASDKFDQQLQAYKDAGNSLTSAKSELETAVSSLNPNRSLENDKKLFLMTDLGLIWLLCTRYYSKKVQTLLLKKMP